MAQKNFTNATGNWIVSDTGEISYTGKVKIDGDLQANDFLDADGNSIVSKSLWTENNDGSISRVGVTNGALAIGESAGSTSQGPYAVALGESAGSTSQGRYAVALGLGSGMENQSAYATAVGWCSGQENQGDSAIAIGGGAGAFDQGESAIAIGFNAGKSNQADYGVIISSDSWNPASSPVEGHIILKSNKGSLDFNGTDKWTFTGGSVQASDFLDSNGNSIVGSGVSSVNGLTGAVNLTYTNVGAEKAFSKATAFNKNFGTTSTTVAYGNHNHNGVYQPAGSYAASNHNHNGVYQPAGSYASTSYAYSKAESNALYEPKGGGGGGDPLDLNNGISLAKGQAKGTLYKTKSVLEIMTTGGSLPNHTGYQLQVDMNGGWLSQEFKFFPANNWGTYSSTPALTIKGDGCYAADFVATSDEKLKKDIVTAKSDVVQQLEGREWNWKDTDKKASGVIAQEIEQILPHLVIEDSEGTKRVSYNGLTAYLIEAVKELSARVQELEESK